MQWQLIAFVATAIWLSGLSFFLTLIYQRFTRLTQGRKKTDLLKALEEVAILEKENKKNLSELEGELARLEKDGLLHIQKVGLVRFNPFNETGGDHSFSLALLNGNQTGVVITGLHTRERTRLYLKPIEKGKSTYELSKEERKAISKAGS